MIFSSVTPMLAAAAAPPAGTNPTASLLQMVGFMVIFGFMFYFAVIRPQRLRTKQLEEMVKALKARDKVLTNGGIIGVVVSVNEKTLTVRSGESKLEVLKSAVAEVLERNAGEPAEAKS